MPFEYFKNEIISFQSTAISLISRSEKKETLGDCKYVWKYDYKYEILLLDEIYLTVGRKQ